MSTPTTLTGRPNLRGGDERVESGTGADVDDPFAWFELPQENGLPTPANDSTARSGRASTVVWS